ncbi:single-stranded DNA-binding protein [Puniceicoccales bacterium CK1056]|uniref:Single-stranded DNA-binding protein n=1 Tax=Oceanipulchritudo coccoides TaxID=2706888 RepID=A0A6B2LZL7_9BACT|nr:uracil-DNA glycosylase family protein [Oceanipulchritudo coccoides]NDV61217.1 single-stranded DNA-binding protein [Oceanipulchritudo coccoides]
MKQQALLDAARELSTTLSRLSFSAPVSMVYNAYDYAWAGHEAYIKRFGGGGRKRVVYLGMNPGPWGMAQTGVPFGEIAAVRDWLGIEVPIAKPAHEHPKRPIEGFACSRSEVSGRRLWGLFAELYESADEFFQEAFILNYCPLSFLSESGANITPDKIAVAERKPLEAACDQHLRTVIELLQPEIAVGVGGFATKCLQRLSLKGPRIGTLLHPSPASPIANREWPGRPRHQLRELGIVG